MGEILNSILTCIVVFFDPATLVGIKTSVALIVADTLLGYVLAVKNGEFSITKIPQFLAKNIFPYIGALIITAGLASYNDSYKALYVLALSGITLKFGYEALKEKLMDILTSK